MRNGYPGSVPFDPEVIVTRIKDGVTLTVAVFPDDDPVSAPTYQHRNNITHFDLFYAGRITEISFDLFNVVS